MIIKSGRRGGPVEPPSPPPPRMSWQGTNLLSSLKHFFFLSLHPPSPTFHPSPCKTSSPVNTGKHFVRARLSIEAGKTAAREEVVGWCARGSWVSDFGSLSARLVAPAVLSVMCSLEGQRLRGTGYFLANGATARRGQGDVKWR